MIRTVPESLRWARELVDPVLKDAVDRLEPDIRAVVTYHLGWANEDGSPTRADGGKAVRPTLTLLAAEAAGADARTALPAAAAIELVHNFSLLHDDVMDRDRERRHRPTAWALFGEARAIVAGDALLALALEILLDEPTPERVRAASSLAHATSGMVAGQSEDLAFESRLDVTFEECLEMCGHKTGALLASACEMGALLAGAGPEVVRALSGFGLHLGLSFQAVDDLLGIWGRPEATGKPAWSDLRQHKKTLPVVAALAGSGGDRLRALLANGHLDEDSIARSARLVEEGGGRDGTEQEARRHLREALGLLQLASLDRGGAERLAELAHFVVGRDF